MSVDTKTLVAQIRDISGLKNNQYFSDTQICEMASDAGAELYDIFVNEQEHYIQKTFDFTLAGGVNGNRVLLPQDFQKESLLELNPSSSNPQTIPMLGDLSMKNQGGSVAVLTSGRPSRQFTISGDYLEIIPASNAAGNYRLTYVPMLETLVLPTPIDLTIKYDRGPVDVTVRLATSSYLIGPALAPTGGTWSTGANEMFLSVPNTTITPLQIDGVTLNLGDVFLIQKDAAPGDGYNTPNPLNMGIWVYAGVDATADILLYHFTRLSGYTSTDPPINYGLRVAVTSGEVYASTILVSQYPDWTVYADTTDFRVASDEDAIPVTLYSGVTIPGAWTQVSPNQLQLVGNDLPSQLLKIDGEQLSLGDTVWFTPSEAPLVNTNMGLWVFEGVENSSPILYYNFSRPVGFLVGDTIEQGVNLFFTSGVLSRNTTFLVQTRILIGTSVVGIWPLNVLGSDGNVILQNAEFDPSYIGGVLSITGSPAGNRSYRITAYHDETSVEVVPIVEPILSEAFGAPTVITATQAGTRDTVPQLMTPWVLYIKLHASIAVREGRELETAALERKLEALKLRVAKSAMNRTEDVSQAPINRHRRRRGGSLGW